MNTSPVFSNEQKDYTKIFESLRLPRIETQESTPTEIPKQKFNAGRWSEEEHQKFIDGILQFGNDWKKVQDLIKTRSSTQARSHAQKFFLKIKKFLNVVGDKQFSIKEEKKGKIVSDNFSIKYFSDLLCTQNRPSHNSICKSNEFCQEKEKLIELLSRYKNGSISTDSNQNSLIDESFEKILKEKPKETKKCVTKDNETKRKIFLIRKVTKFSKLGANGYSDQNSANSLDSSYLQNFSKNIFEQKEIVSQNELLTSSHSVCESISLKNSFDSFFNGNDNQKNNSVLLYEKQLNKGDEKQTIKNVEKTETNPLDARHQYFNFSLMPENKQNPFNIDFFESENIGCTQEIKKKLDDLIYGSFPLEKELKREDEGYYSNFGENQLSLFNI